MRNSQLSLLISSMYVCVAFLGQDSRSLIAFVVGAMYAIIHLSQWQRESMSRHPCNGEAGEK